MSPLGLMTTGRAPFLMVLKPLQDELRLNPPHLLWALIPVPNGITSPTTTRDTPSSASPPETDTVLKERRQNQPPHPHTNPPLTRRCSRTDANSGGRTEVKVCS